MIHGPMITTKYIDSIFLMTQSKHLHTRVDTANSTRHYNEIPSCQRHLLPTWQLQPPPYFGRIKLHETCIKRCVLPVSKLATVRESQKVQRIGYAGKNPIFSNRITCAISDDKITAKTWLSRVTEAGSDHLQKQ